MPHALDCIFCGYVTDPRGFCDARGMSCQTENGTRISIHPANPVETASTATQRTPATTALTASTGRFEIESQRLGESLGNMIGNAIGEAFANGIRDATEAMQRFSTVTRSALPESPVNVYVRHKGLTKAVFAVNHWEHVRERANLRTGIPQTLTYQYVRNEKVVLTLPRKPIIKTSGIFGDEDLTTRVKPGPCNKQKRVVRC